MTDSAHPEPLSLFEFCDTLGYLHTEEQYMSLDADELLKQLQNSDQQEPDLLMPLDTCGEESTDASAMAQRPASEQDDEDILAVLSTYRDPMTRSASSDSEVLTLFPVGSVASVDPVASVTPTAPLPLPIFTNNTSSVISGGIIAQLPPMFKTKLDCPRDGGCSINTVKSLPGGSSCKGKDAIGSKHKFSCLCGLKWQENNWRERERLIGLGEVDTRCIQFLPTQTTPPKRKKAKK